MDPEIPPMVKSMTLQSAVENATNAHHALIKLIGQASVRAWLDQIATIGFDYEEVRDRDTLTNTYFRASTAHQALRLGIDEANSSQTVNRSDYEKACILFRDAEVAFFVPALNSDDIHHIIHAATPFFYAQFPPEMRTPIGVNLLGRGLSLFKEYEHVIKKESGLSLDEIFSIAAALWLLTIKYKTNIFHKSTFVDRFQIRSFTSEGFDNFLKLFSVDIPVYRSNLSPIVRRHEFNGLLQYPVIGLGGDTYCVPIPELILPVTFHLLFHRILKFHEEEKAKKQFFEHYGETFEKYAIDTLLKRHGTHKIPAEARLDNLPKHGECYIRSNNNEIIVIECKRFDFRKDTMTGGNPSDYDRDIQLRIPYAVWQIENSFKAIEASQKSGIIVTDCYIPLANTYLFEQLVREMDNSPDSFPAKGVKIRSWGIRFDPRIVMVDIGTFEWLTAHPTERMFDILNRYFDEAPNIELSLNRRDPFVNQKPLQGMLSLPNTDLSAYLDYEYQYHPELHELFKIVGQNAFPA